MPPLAPPRCQKGTRALRRCTCGGIIGLLLFGVVPSFKVFKSQGGAKDDAHCSNLLLLALGPSPNKSLQRAAQP
jgi:hypothetical protein